MGIDYRAAIFVGLPRKELADVMFGDEKKLDLQNVIDEGDLEVCPPYYDGNDESYAIVGFELAGSETYVARELVYDQGHVDDLKAKFKALTGLEAKLYISPYGY